MNDDFSFDGADAADMPLDLSFSSLPLPEGEAAAGFHLPEMEPGTGQEQAAADINLLNGSDVMETTPSPFPAPEDPSETEFRPQLTDPESLHDQGAMMMYGAAEREERRRKDKQARLMDVLRAGAMDGEGRKKAAELWGQDALNRLDLASEHDRAYMLGNRLMETIGDGDRDVGRQIYKNANNLWGTDVVTADQIWKDFQGRHQKTLDAYNENLKRVQTEQEEISRRIVDCVAGKEGSWDACPADLLKYAESPQKVADSIMRARRAYAFAERRGFEDVWRSDALDMADLLTVNVNGNEVLDQQALMLLMTAIDRKVQESQTDSAAFWRNLYRSFADTARGAESLGVKAVQAVRGIPGMSGMEEWYSNNIAPLQGVKDTFDGQRQLFDRYEQRREALNTMQDVMHEFGQRMRGTSPDASWYVKAINGAGNITGQSLSYMAPGGWALVLAGDMGHAGNAASRNGDSLVDVTINGLRNTVEEKGFGVFSVFGRMGAINKLMTRTGTGALARLAAKVPGRTFFAGTRTGKMLSTPAFAYVEEMAAEPLAGELFEWTARKLSGMTGMEVKPKDFEVVGPVLQAMGDVEQSGGCALFVAAMAAGHAPRMKQEVAAFVTDAQRAQLAGYTKKHAEEMASFSTAEHKAALAQKYFETDVLKDPEGAAERARKAGAELADRQEARLYQMSGALDKVLEKANIGRIRKLEGTDRYEVSLREGAVVNGVKMEEDRSVEMNEEQTDALVQVVLQGAYLNGVRVMQDAVLGNAAISEAGKMDFIETLDMLSEEAPAEYRKAAAETGGMTVPGLMDVAARAQARIDAIVREEGVSVQEARSRTDAEVMGKVQLGSIADLAAAFERRLDHAVRSGEITRGRADEIKSGTAAASFAHRFTMAADPGSSLLLYAGGHATTANVMEDVQESALVHYMNLTGKDWQDLWEHLQAADAVLGRYGVSLGTYEGPAHDARDVVESFSNLSLSSSLADIESLPVPQWVKDTAEFALKNLEDSARIIRMGEQWNEFAATDEGKKFMEEHGGLADALQAVGVSTESVFRQARMDAAQKLDVEMVHADLASRRAPGDATMTLGELEALEESMARMDAAEDVEETAEEEDETDPVTGIAGNSASPAPLVEDAGGSLEGVGEEAEHDEEAGAEFRDHAFVRVAPDCVFAQVRVDSLALAPDVEQFKQGDHNERGAVKGRELQGRFREDAQPISVWRRRDGTLHVITGRHRFDLAVRDGVEFIPAYVYEEDDAHDATWAKMHDVGQNMLDGQASALEVAFFVRNSNMGRDEMEAQGYLRPGSANVMGWDIATLAGDEVFTRLKNGVITDNEAWKVCRLSSTEAGQMLALQLREKGKPWDYVAAYVKEADRVAAEKSREGEAFDLFGNDTSWQEDCEKVARFAARGIALIAERLSLLKKSRGISRRKDLAGRMGIRLETDADLNAAIHDLERAKGAWQSHDPALRLHDRALAWDGTSEVNPFERVPVSGATFSVVAMDSSGTVLAPETFVTREDGSPDWFVIPRRKRQPAMPVRLLVGSDVGEHRGYGLTHILASRGFSFWKDRSPERYISSILANVSELYEVAPGRELLVKGRQPSSWMLLQLDRKDGFYSIVSAYPVRQGKKPLGKKLPLAERQPANANSGTARLGPGSASKAALPSQSAGGGDGFSLPQGAHVVNVNEVECRFDDGAIVPATFSLSLEKETIRKKAVADGTFMKAPNGKDTNLTEDQWLSVRTEAFKNWFGDWEKDPQNASKVVDENGEPRVVYHGSHQWFTSFNDGKQRQQSGAPAGTIFANDNREIAVSFADYYGGHADEVILDPNDERHPRYSWGIYREGGIYDLFMNIRNPLVVDFEGRPWLDSSKGGDINALCSKAKESGHDGVIALNIVDAGLNDQENVPASTDYVAFDSVQVKSATQNRGTYDPKNPDITFSIVSAQDQGLFHDGHFEAGNAVITEPGVTFSITALHASPHSFRKFSTDFMGKGEGAQAYGWGLYFAENPKVNRSYMNQFAQDKATWKFREVETGVIEVMQRSLVGSFLPKDALPEAKEDASDIAWSVLGDLVDAARGSMTVLDVVMELHDEIDTNRKYAETYPQEREKLEQLEGFMLSLLDHLDEIEVRTGMPSNYRVELNVEDSELLGWDYVDETVLALLKDSPVEEVRYALERAERRADYRGENVSGKDVYQELFDAFWDGEDGTKQEAQKAASVSLLSSDIKGIRYADGLSRWKEKEEQTYNYVIFDGNDIKITAFADESTGGAWADYEDPTATFSIIGEKAASFQEYHNNGLSYTDPADGKRKAIIDSRGVRLRKEHVSVSEGGHVNVSLAAALDFPELFRAYPELRKLRVDFYRDSRSGTGGFTDPQEHYIAVNVARGGKNAAPGMVLDTILHEVQHVIQGYEGFAQGAGNMSREQALAYLGESMSQLAGRDDAWAKEALPRLERMRQELEAGTLQPAFVYVFSHGEQEARLAGSFEKNSEGVVMSGLNGFRLLDAPPFSIPLTGDITELGGITFGAGRFGRMAGRVLAPNGDWLYDEMVFRMRAAAQRSVSKLRLFETGDRERGLELLAEAQELISTVERFLPHTYGFGLEPYKIWLNVFSLLYGNSGKMAPGDAVASALEAIPMKRWPEIMEGSIGKSFVNWAEKRPELEDVVEEARREIAERQADYELDSAPDADNRAALAARKGVEQEVWRRLFEEHGAEFLEEYGEQKVFRLVGKFMARVVEQIDRFRKDRTLGRIRRVAASVAPRTNPQGKPLRGKMDAESYRRLEDRLRLMEMTPAQYDAFFRKNFPEVLDEEAAGQQEGRTLWEDVKPQDMVTVETTDAEGGALALTVTKATFEAYACYEKMSVETAENAARALGEFIATRREAWENAAESKKNEIEDLLRPVLEAAGRTDDQAMATHRKQARLKTLPSGPMSLTGYLLNFSQYMQGLQSVPAFRGIAKKFERRAARFAVQKQACEKDTLAFVKKAAGRILQTEDEYEIADWIYEQRGGLDTGLTITEQEPDWQGKAREEYRAGVLNLIRRKVRKRGAARTLAHVAFLMKDMDAELKAEIERIWPDARDEVWSEKDAAVFTEKELDRYGSQEKYVEEHAARARKASKWGKGKSPYQAQSYKLDHISRMEAAYIILLSQQEDYQEMLRLKGFTQEILEGLEQFAGSEVMEFSRALREKLNERGQEVKEVTESRYGAPFPMIENYFRAFFDVGIEAIDQSIMDAASYGDAATGGKFGLIHARKKHHASLDLSIDVLTAYYAAMNEQDVYLYGSEISRDMRALINYRGENGTRGARVLEKVIGRDALNKLLVWCDSFDKGMAGNVRGFLEMQKSLNRISSAAAITLLPGRVGTWLKQSTALINAAFSSDEIDPHEWAASMARMAAGKLALSPRELMKRAALDARDATETAVIREAMSADEAGRAASGAWKRLNVKGMNLLTQTDVGLNAVSSAILYDAVYRKEMKRNPGLSREEADRRAMMEVELSLSRKAQPMTPQQRSLAAQTRSVWNVGMLFLGGESINTFAETVALWKQGGMKNKAKSVSMFYAHGLLLASMSAMLNFFTDDERRRKRREWWHIFIDALQGPLQGIPFLGALAGGAVRGMSSLCGYRYYEATTSLVPFASWDNLERAGKDLAKLFDGKDKDWVDFPLAFMGALRMAAFGAALGGASTPKGARFKAAAFSAAAFVNLTEFLLRAMKGLPLRLDGK